MSTQEDRMNYVFTVGQTIMSTHFNSVNYVYTVEQSELYLHRISE